jgi:hypothetical protein
LTERRARGVGAAFVAALLVAGCAGREAGEGSAFAVGDTIGIGSGWVPTGERHTWGLQPLSNTTPAPVILESVELLSVSPGLRVLGMTARPFDEESKDARGDFGYVAMAHEWPPNELIDPRQTRPIAGLVVGPRAPGAPGPWVSVMVGLVADQPGWYGVRRWAVTYRAGRVLHRQVFDESFSMCVTDDATVLAAWRSRSPTVPHCEIPLAGPAPPGSDGPTADKAMEQWALTEAGRSG